MARLGPGVHHWLDITTLAITQTVVLVVPLALMLTAVGSVCVVCHVAFFSSCIILLRSILRKLQIPHYFSNMSLFLFSLSCPRVYIDIFSKGCNLP